ncbi:MAG: carbon-nitrogen hydrolase [Bacteroidetes bacterium]|nr:carbon-nitrogen hydrolase [Bacteroidota bacterium]
MKKILIIIVLVIGVWIFWATIGRSEEWTESKSFIEQQESITLDSSCSRHIVGIQPYMLTTDYASEKHFYEKLNTYFEAAQEAGYFNEKTVVVLPEYLGTWLVVNGEKKSALHATTVTNAMTIMVLSNPIKFIRSLFNGKGEKDAFAAAIFKMKATTMSAIYCNVFKTLASKYQVAISAGSIVLPSPTIKNENEINVDITQPLYNCSFVFNANGTIDPQIVKKSFLIDSELSFLQAHPINQLPIYNLPIGKTSVLICADSWYPESYEQLNKLMPEIVLVGSFCVGNKTMNAVWNGYNGSENPADVEKSDLGKITEQQAWIKYAMPGRISSTKTPLGVNVFLKGELWDLGADGNPFIVREGKLQDVKSSAKAGIWNVCF